MNPAGDKNCSSARALLDRYVDREMGLPELAGMEAHLGGCPDCTVRATHRSALRDRLRAAARNTQPPGDLEGRIRQRLGGETAAWHRNRLRPAWPVWALAAVLLLTAGLANSWRNGGLRFTDNSRQAYIASLSREVSPVMRIGLEQHVHCAVFRKVPSQWPTLGEMVQSLGPQYAMLAPAMERHLPRGFRIAEAHLCSYQGRRYTHLAATNGSKLISLLITNRGQGEAFETDLRAVAEESGDPIYGSSVQRFRMAGFETREHFIYLVSDLDTGRNLSTLRSMLPDVDRAIRHLEI